MESLFKFYRLKFFLRVILLLFSVSVFAQSRSDKPLPVEFKKTKVKVGSENNMKEIRVELAQTEAQRERGLMFRKSLPENEGMLFIFEEERTLGFWMKNTFIDLSIGYFDRSKKLIDIQEMKATSSIMQSSQTTYTSIQPAQFALEMNRGWFKKNRINVGDSLILIEEKPSKVKK